MKKECKASPNMCPLVYPREFETRNPAAKYCPACARRIGGAMMPTLHDDADWSPVGLEVSLNDGVTSVGGYRRKEHRGRL